MTPLGNCPGCGGDEPFQPVHAGNCPDAGADAGCPEWACPECGAAFIMGTVSGTVAAAPATPASRRARAA